MPVRYDQDPKDDHRKEDHSWLPHGTDGGSAARHGMGHAYRGRAAQRRHRPISIPDAIQAAAPRPVPIIAGWGSADEPVAARWFQAASPSTVQVRVVPHAGHTQGLATAPRAWEAHMISFLNTALNPATTPVGQGAGHNGWRGSQSPRPAAGRRPRPGEFLAGFGVARPNA